MTSKSNVEFVRENAEKLLGFVPVLSCWLLQQNPKEAANELATIGPRRGASRHTTEALRVLTNLPDISEVSSLDIRDSLDEFSLETWYRVFYLVLSNSEYPVMARNCYKGILEKKDELKEAIKTSKLEDELLEHVWEMTQRLPIKSFNALSEVCVIVRDSSTNAMALAQNLGPKFLLPEDHDSIQFKSLSKESSMAYSKSGNYIKGLVTEEEIREAGILFKFLVSFCEKIFFRYRTDFKRPVPPSGYRMRLIRPKDHKEVALKTMISQLQEFYRLADAELITIAPTLFEYFTFPQIAKALFEEYRYIPKHWVQELAQFDYGDDIEHKMWFKKHEGSFTELSTDNMDSVEEKVREYEMNDKDETELDKVVAEFFIREHQIWERLHIFQREYVPELMDFCLGGKGEKAQKKVGLSTVEVQRVFGRRIETIANAMKDFLIALEPLRLVRSQIKTEEGGIRTRAGALAEIFVKQGKELVDCFLKYTIAQDHCNAIVKAAKDKLKKDSRYKNFDDIFVDFVESHPIFRGYSLENILLQPCAKFPQYKLYFDRMYKIVEKRYREDKTVDRKKVDEELNRIKEAMTVSDKFSTGINDNLKSRAKAQKIRGEILYDV